jgi:8-oxo-dGTP pyrophosphatase MutT (NUDIX family)
MILLNKERGYIMKKDKKDISATTIITDGKEILLGRITGNGKGHYDFPKGIIEEGEHPKDTAVREVFEETGLKIEREKLVDIGIYSYLPYKDLCIFLYQVPDMYDIDIKKLECISYFTRIDNKGNEIKRPEINGYLKVGIYDIHKYISEKLCNTFNSFIEKLLESLDFNLLK